MATTKTTKYPETVSIAIIGAGVGGICLALDLQKRGLNDYTIFDADTGIGGTWYQNNYPGCRCDVAAVWYSHSRFPNPNWTETHPQRPEILSYWQTIAKSQGIDHHVRLSHKFLSADWDADAGEYTITVLNQVTNEQVVTRAKVLVSAIGGFHTPLYPNLKGQDKFRGKIVHCARWPKDLTPADLRGKKVAVIGNGCSGIQALTALADDNEIELISVARSAHWYLPNRSGGPRNSVPYSEARRAAYRRFPVLQSIERNFTYIRSEVVWPIFKMTPVSNLVRSVLERQLKAWMRAKMPKELIPQAIPDFPVGSKRIVIEDGYFTALNKKNVTPVWGGLTGFTDTGIVIDNEQVMEADVVILSTGFDLESGNLDVAGSTTKVRDFKHISDLKAYHSMAAPGMPNYFLMLGPFSAAGHASITFILETQASYIAQLIAAIKSEHIKALEPTREATEKWYNKTSERAEKTVWARAKSYMRSRGGEGKVWTHYPGFVGEIWWTNRTPEWSDYAGAEKLARRQVARRRIRRAVLAAALIVAARYYVPTQWLTDAHSSAAAVGVPAALLDTVATVITAAAGHIDSVVDSARAWIKW